MLARALGAFAAVLLVTAPPAARAAEPPPPVQLAEGWQVTRTPGDASSWRNVQMPHVLEPAPLERHFGGGVAWYRLSFTGPPTPPGFGWGLRFEQARRSARVRLNGAEIGGSDDPYVAFELDAPGLRPGATNDLVVQVDNRRHPELREGWWNWGGLVRPVWLVPRGAVELRDTGLMSRLACRPACGDAAVLVDATVVNRSQVPLEPEVDVTLTAPAGTVSRGTLRPGTLAPGASRRVREEVAVAGDPELWSPARPLRYAALVRMRVGDQVVHERRSWIGLRSVEVRGGRLHLNGRALQLRGASIQEDAPGRGPALTPADVDWIGRELRAVRSDVTRAHYGLNERLLNRLDKLGILLWSQSPIYHHDVMLRRPEERARALSSVRGTVLAARSHPSVITHSVANELSSFADREEGTRLFLRDARRLARDLDPTLPVSVDLLGRPGLPRQRSYGAFDLLGANAYFGWYEGPADRPTANLADLGPFLRRLRRQYRRQAIVLTEFGAEAIASGPARVKGTYAHQLRYLRRVRRIVDRLPFLSGAIYWTLREFAVKPRWFGGGEPPGVPRDGIHDKGLITYDGRRKPAWRYARRWFRRVPLFRRPAARAAGG
jgi:beta-glucuronidase